MKLPRVFAWLLVIGPFWPVALAFWLKAQPVPDSGLLHWYATTNPLVSSAIVSFLYTTLLFVLGELIHNHSIFDFNWSMLPAAFYAPLYALHPLSSPNMTRFWLLFVAVSLWSVRLSGNWLYKGGLGFEDFRYRNYRATMSPKVFFVFAYTVLFLVQIAMVYGMVTPIYVAFRSPTPVNLLDYGAFVVVVAGTAFELVADAQQHRFRRLRDEGKTTSRFCNVGLWRYSRHPNYFGEMCVWWGVYLFAVASGAGWLNWAIVGPLTVCGLFFGGSIKITEAHELARKPEYAEYQRTTSRVFPLPPRA